jgi:hypothetical protein
MSIEERLKDAAPVEAVDIETDRRDVEVRGRRRQQRRRLVGGAAALALLLGVGVAAFGLDDDEQTGEDIETVETPEEESLGPIDQFVYEYDTRPIREAPLSPRSDAVSVWTGETWIVWGGVDDVFPVASGPGVRPPGGRLVDGAIYNPTVDEWTPMSSAPLVLPASSEEIRSVWVGDRLAVAWIGADGRAFAMTYTPASDSWKPAEIVTPPELDASGIVDLELAAAGDELFVALQAPHAVMGSALVVGLVEPDAATWDVTRAEPLAGERQLAIAAGDDRVAVLATTLVDSEGDGSSITSTEQLAIALDDLAVERFTSVTGLPTWNARLFDLGDRLAIWGGRPTACGVDGAAPCSTNPEASLGVVSRGLGGSWEPMAGTIPWDEGGRATQLGPGDSLVTASGWYTTGGLGAQGPPPTYGPGTLGIYDPSTNRWMPLGGHDDDGDPVAGPRVGPREAFSWTGEELVVLTSQREIRTGGSEAFVYGPPWTTTDWCEPGEPGANRPAPWPYWRPSTAASIEELDPAELARSNAGWTHVAVGQQVGQPAVMPPRGTSIRPEVPVEVVDPRCNVIGMYLDHLGAMTLEEWEVQSDAPLDLTWYLDSYRVRPPRGGEVVRELRLGGDRSGTEPAIELSAGGFIIADPEVDLFGAAIDEVPDLPRWRPDPELGTAFSEKSGGGIITGRATRRWAPLAELQPGNWILLDPGQAGQRAEFEVAEVERFDGEDEPRRRDEHDLELHIIDDDGTTVVYLNFVEPPPPPTE